MANPMLFASLSKRNSHVRAVMNENVFECPICLETLSNPVTLPCGHNFCQACIAAARDFSPKCATCRAPIPPRVPLEVNRILRDAIHGVEALKQSGHAGRVHPQSGLVPPSPGGTAQSDNLPGMTISAPGAVEQQDQHRVTSNTRDNQPPGHTQQAVFYQRRDTADGDDEGPGHQSMDAGYPQQQQFRPAQVQVPPPPALMSRFDSRNASQQPTSGPITVLARPTDTPTAVYTGCQELPVTHSALTLGTPAGELYRLVEKARSVGSPLFIRQFDLNPPYALIASGRVTSEQYSRLVTVANELMTQNWTECLEAYRPPKSGGCCCGSSEGSINQQLIDRVASEKETELNRHLGAFNAASRQHGVSVTIDVNLEWFEFALIDGSTYPMQTYAQNP